MVNGSHVVVNAANAEIRGEITHLIPRSINVTIMEPWSGVEQGLSIPYFGCWGRPPELYFQHHGIITEHGVRTAESLLSQLGHGCGLFQTHRTALAAQFAELLCLHLLRRPTVSDEEFRMVRTRLRSLLRSGAISNVQYQKVLTPINKHIKRRTDSEFEATTALSLRLRETHGTHLPLDTLRQLIRKFLG